MKNFDTEWQDRKSLEQRTFVLCGQQFIRKAAVRPEVFDDLDEPEESDTVAEAFVKIDAQFIAMIEPGENDEAVGRYQELRERGDALGPRDIRDVINWMVEELTGRSPTLRSDSSPGRTRTGTRSTGGSSSRGLAAA